jgi:hypothetical protein
MAKRALAGAKTSEAEGGMKGKIIPPDAERNEAHGWTENTHPVEGL